MEESRLVEFSFGADEMVEGRRGAAVEDEEGPAVRLEEEDEDPEEDDLGIRRSIIACSLSGLYLPRLALILRAAASF